MLSKKCLLPAHRVCNHSCIGKYQVIILAYITTNRLIEKNMCIVHYIIKTNTLNYNL